MIVQGRQWQQSWRWLSQICNLLVALHSSCIYAGKAQCTLLVALQTCCKGSSLWRRIAQQSRDQCAGPIIGTARRQLARQHHEPVLWRRSMSATKQPEHHSHVWSNDRPEATHDRAVAVYPGLHSAIARKSRREHTWCSGFAGCCCCCWC